MDELLKQKMFPQTTPKTTTTAAPLEGFFTDLESDCKAKKGTYRRGNAWNQGFDGSVQVNPTQVRNEETALRTENDKLKHFCGELETDFFNLLELF